MPRRRLQRQENVSLGQGVGNPRRFHPHVAALCGLEKWKMSDVFLSETCLASVIIWLDTRWQCRYRITNAMKREGEVMATRVSCVANSMLRKFTVFGYAVV